MARHRRSRSRWRRAALASLAAGVVAAAVLAGLHVSGRTGAAAAAPSSAAVPADASAPATSAPAPLRSSSTSSSISSSSIPSATGAGSASASGPPTATGRTAAARRSLARLIAAVPTGGVSVAAVDLTTGVAYAAGATKGMRTGSLGKVQVLETLLLRQRHAGTALTNHERALATAMIEHSDNDAADDLFAVFGHAAYVAAEPALGLSRTATVPGTGDYWGLTRTSAMQQLVLIRDLVGPSSPLTATQRTYALGLMRAVESDQRWGVGVVADKGTTFANKDGWLSVDADHDRWLANSAGVVQVHGHRLLMVIMTQHEPSFDAGVDLVERLARPLAAAVGPS